MRNVAIVAVAIAGLLASCGGGGATVQCDPVCQKMLECDPQSNLQECLDQCQTARDLFRGVVFDSLANCLLDLPCGTSDDQCFQDALAKAPDGAADGMLQAYCQGIIDCNPGETDLETCMAMLKSEGGEYIDYLEAMSDSVLDCMTSCIKKGTCEQLQSDSFMDTCASECGLDALD